MEGVDLSPGAIRRVMETAFEPYGKAWVYYRNAWSGGVPVNDQEREMFVGAFNPESHRAFHARIEGRMAVTPARGPFKPLGMILRALLRGVLPLILASTLAAITLALYDSIGAWRAVLWALAVVFAIVGAVMFFFRRGRP